MSAEDLMLRLELMALQDRYVAAIDNDRIEEWPGFFTEECLYEIVSRENEEAGLPAPVMYCDSAGMLRDRVLALRHANIYERPAYRHMLSGLEWKAEEDGSFSVSSSYVVVNTSIEGESTIYQAGRYLDKVVRTPEGLRFRQKRCIYDTLRVQTLLAFPI
ncbi:anthranilate 1,2-dioxygenase [Roseomonas sp. KE2513]|uniref:anthranilate 1,2-dioxygenase small subunit AndAd n=1 Tax=Roseomonas sp. KE2513 TaxID=2479202 RepID=UPI0018DF451E|nr:anthranilate 1,2-dioxygenase small subunit AndAd [Roseomonas sp. KE2513]MBI0535958.1 anthranilate 1,2-dioxygenase [Roseomonas sp. KE2513]